MVTARSKKHTVQNTVTMKMSATMRFCTLLFHRRRANRLYK